MYFMTLVPYKQHVFPLPLSLSDKDGQTDGGTNESWANKRGSAPRLVLRLGDLTFFSHFSPLPATSLTTTEGRKKRAKRVKC